MSKRSARLKALLLSDQMVEVAATDDDAHTLLDCLYYRLHCLCAVAGLDPQKLLHDSARPLPAHLA